MCVEISRAAFPDLENTSVIDVGSATGYTMQQFKDAGYRRVHGVDNSPAMLAVSRVQENLIHAATFPKDRGPFQVILANWTLHFIDEREKYLHDIFDGLGKDGIFILSEKMLTDALVHDRYHDFKRSQGMTEVEIRAKEEAIKGVLTPRPLGWYLETLKEAGFSKIEVINAHWCFNTLLCRA